jgi:hypothetical protein
MNVRKPLTILGLAATMLAPSALAGCSNETSSKVELGVTAIIFMSRAHTVVGPNGAVDINVSGGNGQVIDYDRYVPGGSLNVLSPARPDGTVYNLTKDFPEADFNGVDVSFDAKLAVFSMKKNGNDHYHIYTVSLENLKAKPEIHQLTAGDQDDINPIFLPGRRIAFATNQMYTEMGTRADEYNHGRRVSQLATITLDGGDADRHLFAQNLSHTVAPFLRYDGKIGYSRWEHLGPINDVKLFAANPDGTNMIALGGQHGKPGNSLINVVEYAPNQMVGITTTRNRTIHAGTLIKIDARNQNDPVCLDANATPEQLAGHACLDEENLRYEMLTPDVPTGNGPSPAGRYREPSVLPDGRIIVSWADGPVNDLSEQSVTPPDFGIYVFDPKTGKNQLVFNDRKFWDLGAKPVVARKEPPVIGDIQKNADSSIPSRIGSVDVTQTSLKETVNGAQLKDVALNTALREAVKVRIIEGFSSEAAKGVTMFGLTMHEGGAILGEADIAADGSWFANIPPYVPVHLQPIDKYGMAIRNQMTWIQGNPGEYRRCIGCHESRTGQGVPRYGQNPTVAEQRGPQNFRRVGNQLESFYGAPTILPIADRLELPWDKNDEPGKIAIQPILTAKCAQCHNATQNGSKPQEYYTVTMTNPANGQTGTYRIPRLDLSETPITVYYDRQVRTYPASYVSIFYPAALEMERGTVMGTIPPKWGIPGNARQSELIAYMNVQAPDQTFAYGPKPMHPEDVGVTVTSEERLALIRAFDLGGQFYARQNTQFVPNSKDPVAPGANYK